MPVDMQRARREGMRWYLLLAMHRGEPVGAGDLILKTIIDDIYENVTVNELHTQMSYLEKCELISLEKTPTHKWHGKLTAVGVNFVEYNADDIDGIKRPPHASSW